ncbi:MAG: hypothetical protein ACUVQ5_04970 [Candidatus Methanomethylicaceae archaeon]
MKAKVKRNGQKENTMVIVKSKGKPIFCRRNGLWKDELEKRLKEGGEIVLLALGNMKYHLLSHLNKRRDIEILRLETRHMKSRRATGLKAIVRKRRSQRSLNP